MTMPPDATNKAKEFAPRCVSLDLEVGKENSRIHSLAGVKGDSGDAFTYKGSKEGELLQALAALDRFADSSAFLLGHNLIAFDLPHLAAAKPDLRLLALPAVDTLRLNPLAFPRNPYHHLVKHYQDGQLEKGQLNDPELDARLTLKLFADQSRAFRELNEADPALLTAWHWLTTASGEISGLNAFFTTIRRTTRPSEAEALAAIMQRLAGHACLANGRAVLAERKENAWALAYALAWLSVAGGNSVMPPWVCHQFPAAGKIVKALRDVSCGDPACAWCSERHDARKELERWFGFSAFRAEPRGTDGRSLQQSIVEAAMQGRHVLGILPTGTGKSLCYQIPALSRYDKTGALTVVISPLVALMADQVSGLLARGISSCAAINGLLSMPERADVLDRVRLGDVGILIVSPEQLRNKTLRKVLAQREIGAWVLDEAHCISKWGHDFRPDYRYVGRFIKEKAGADPIPPVLCLTATAKPDVIADMCAYFKEKVGIDLQLFNGGADRTNLDFLVVPTSPAEKLAHIYQMLAIELTPDSSGGAIVYCASRKGTEEVAEYLVAKGMAASYFHAGMPGEAKKDTQQRFIQGALRVIAATNAFGMGIDKPDVRLVIHADIPGSLENYLQEAGRAGRDQQAARCVLLYTERDAERQFSMSARSRLTQKEIQAILKSLKTLDRKKRMNGEIVATTGEILAEELDGAFDRDSVTDDTRVRTALAWLEEASLLQREENHVQVFPSSLRIKSLQEAEEKLAKKQLFADYRRQLLSIVRALISADPDDGISTDELMGVSGMSAQKVCSALYELEKLGIASNDTGLTAFVHAGVERSSHKRYAEAAALEIALIDVLREDAPDMAKGEAFRLQLRQATQRLKDRGHAQASPESITRLLKSIAADGRGEEGGVGSLQVRRHDAENVKITLQREWGPLTKTARLRRLAGERLLEHLMATLAPGERGNDLLAKTTLGNLLAAIEQDMHVKAEAKDIPKLLDRALMWLHEQEVIRLNKGLAVFRPAMTIRLEADRRGFVKADFAPLKMHYDEQVVQIHVMDEYARRGLEAIANALQLVSDYFRLRHEEFMQRWLPGRDKELARQTTPTSWRAIVEDLNPAQQEIVTDEREQTNVLVLAGPGSGKTRVLVHRIAYLVRVKRENPHSILALAYNRHAAAEIRRRLQDLIGDDARGVVVMTCHALAMRLAGISFAKRPVSEDIFDAVLKQAIALLKGEGLPPEDVDEQRDRLLAAFSWILVDEYQDIGPTQYELISALAGRTRTDEDGRLRMFAVGDDDQNIYAFSGASVQYIRRFESDYKARPAFLIHNYRSTRHIIHAANLVIAQAQDRLKADRPITIDRARVKADHGGAWEKLDPVAKGRVQIVPAGRDPVEQAQAVMIEFSRLALCVPDWDWARVAVIAREWKYLEPIRSYCELQGIPVQMANEDSSHFWRARETRLLVDWLREEHFKLIDSGRIRTWLAAQTPGPCWAWMQEAIDQFALETDAAEIPVAQFIEWLVEWGREVRRRQSGVMLLTAHRAKGLEFDHVAVLDGGWEQTGAGEDQDASRRLFYVAMTRARQTLLLMQAQRGRHPFLHALGDAPCILRRVPIALPPQQAELHHTYLQLSLREIDLGYAGRQSPHDLLHRRIQQLAQNDPVMLRQDGSHWHLTDADAGIVGRLSKAFTPPQGMVFVSGKIKVIVDWHADDQDPAFRVRTQCERWEVIVPELIFAPAMQTAQAGVANAGSA